MRHQYTPIFRDLLTSSLWATSTPATKVVWITLLLDADPEGYVPMSIPGLAQRAGVTLQEAEAALITLLSADRYSRTTAHEGRRIEAVDHGWLILNFVSWRARAVAEAEKARKRNWASQHRAKPANDNSSLPSDNSLPRCSRCGNWMARVGDETGCLLCPVDACSGSSETLDAPKPKPKLSSPKKGKNGSAPPPPVEAQTIGAVFRTLEGWEPSQELRDEAKLLGIADFDERLAHLRTGPIGGQRGVLDRDRYVRAQLPKWRRWAETERAKAQQGAAAGPGRRFGDDRGGPPPSERKLVPGAPQWVYEEHAQFAKDNGLSLKRAVAAFARQSRINPDMLKPQDVRVPFRQFLENLSKQAVA